MPNPFDITTTSNTVTLDNNRTGVAVFTVKNNTRRRIHSTARLTTQPPAGEKWLTLLPPENSTSTDSPNAREFPIDGTQSFQVKIAVPVDGAPGAYTMTLTVADDNNPDDNFSVSPGIIFTVKEIPKPEPRPFPIWIIPAIIIAVLVIVVIIVVAVVTTNNQHVHETETAVAAVRLTSDAETAVAVQQTIAAQTAVAVQTQTAFQAFLGTWNPVGGSQPISGMLIEDAGSFQVNITLSASTCTVLIFCNGFPAQVFRLTNIPIIGQQISVAVSSLQMFIRVADKDQLVVASTVPGAGSSQLFVRVRSAAPGVSLNPSISLSGSALSAESLSALEALSAGTSTLVPTSAAVTETPTPQ